MTDSVGTDRSGKRERLVASAAELMHRHGVPVTTLAQVAQAADVPPGNVYYYFKTRDDLVRAVIQARAEQIRGLISAADTRRTPAAALKALLRSWADMREVVASYGCPIGTLCADLGHGADDLANEATGLLRMLLDWSAAKFRLMGRRDADDLAVALVGGVEGAALLSHSLRDAELLHTRMRAMERWVDSLV
jgi:TetR/AcrR family transcriptional regulator, transcriptional repressor for nem operon